MIKKNLLLILSVLLTISFILPPMACDVSAESNDDRLVTIIEVKKMSTDGIKLIWSEIGADKYELYRNGELIASQKSNNYLDDVGRIMGQRISYEVKALKNNKTYEYDYLDVIYNPFVDVFAGSNAYAYVSWAYNEEIVNGLSSNHSLFGLYGKCTRAQFCVMLWKMAGKPSTKGMKCPFEDIGGLTGNTKNAVVWCYNQGIVGGTSPTTFTPNGNISRVQLAVMIWKMYGSPSIGSMTCPYTDLDELSSNSRKAVIWCYNNDMINSVVGKSFSPKTKGTRYLLTEMLYYGNHAGPQTQGLNLEMNFYLQGYKNTKEYMVNIRNNPNWEPDEEMKEIWDQLSVTVYIQGSFNSLSWESDENNTANGFWIDIRGYYGNDMYFGRTYSLGIESGTGKRVFKTYYDHYDSAVHLRGTAKLLQIKDRVYYLTINAYLPVNDYGWAKEIDGFIPGVYLTPVWLEMAIE